VTDHPVRSFREIFAAFDDVGFGKAGRNAGPQFGPLRLFLVNLVVAVRRDG
jgi:hypothetical protein